MAELLIRLRDNTHTDPAKDRMCYKRGDIVVVMPDGHQWGRAEGLPDFAVIKTDAAAAQLERFVSVHEEDVTETRTLPLSQWTAMKSRGDYGPFSSMPAEVAQRTAMVKNGTKRRKLVRTVTLTGPVRRPHTRRRWGVVEALIPAQLKKELLSTGMAWIPFAKLRLALRDKITGAQA